GNESLVFRRGLGLYGEGVARTDDLAHPGWRSVHQDVAAFYPALQATAAMPGHQLSQYLVQPFGHGRGAQAVFQDLAQRIAVFVVTHGVQSYNWPAMLTPRMLT